MSKNNTCYIRKTCNLKVKVNSCLHITPNTTKPPSHSLILPPSVIGYENRCREWSYYFVRSNVNSDPLASWQPIHRGTDVTHAFFKVILLFLSVKEKDKLKK